MTTDRQQEPITGLDHVLVGVTDLESARRAWARLGFTVTPRGRHIGWGTANYCIMFERDYIELLGILDPNQFTNNLDRFLESGEGLLGLAFATGDPDDCHSTLRKAGLSLQAPKVLKRLLELPEGTVTPEFRLLHFEAGQNAGLPAFICQHLTPDMVWHPAWCRHANGAKAVSEIELVAGDLSSLARLLTALLGQARLEALEDRVIASLGACRLTCRQRPSARGAQDAAVELTALAVSVEDLPATEALLAEAALPLENQGDRIVLPPATANGVRLSFIRDKA